MPSRIWTPTTYAALILVPDNHLFYAIRLASSRTYKSTLSAELLAYVILDIWNAFHFFTSSSPGQKYW